MLNATKASASTSSDRERLTFRYKWSRQGNADAGTVVRNQRHNAKAGLVVLRVCMRR